MKLYLDDIALGFDLIDIDEILILKVRKILEAIVVLESWRLFFLFRISLLSHLSLSQHGRICDICPFAELHSLLLMYLIEKYEVQRDESVRR